MAPSVKTEARNGKLFYFHSFSNFGNSRGLPDLYYILRSKIFDLDTQHKGGIQYTSQYHLIQQLEASIQTSVMTKEECLKHLESSHFPNCKVTYEEKWIETQTARNTITKILEKGILVDWS
jgi:hypothetical protein